MTIKGRLLSSTTTVKPKSAEYLIKKKEKITNSEKPLSRVYKSGPVYSPRRQSNGYSTAEVPGPLLFRIS